MRSAYSAENKTVINLLKSGADVNATDPFMGLTALHIAVSTNNLTLTRILVEDWNAAFKADATGRWPTLIAAEAEVDDALSDYIVEAEAKAYCANCSPA
nr:ankyrin repeat domain-containing protein [Shinella pollutisoli]